MPERAKDLAEDFLITEVNELGIVDAIDALVNGVEKPEDMHNAMKLFVSTRWFFNLWLIALPWSAFSFLLWLYNIVFNAWLNKGWAEGNFYLLFNSYICWSQWLNSLGLAFEWPFYMRQFELERWISLITAFTYNDIYLSFLFIWLWELYDLSEQQLDEIGAFDVLLNMFFIYNCILHSSIVVINFGIILKEFNLEFYEMFKMQEGAGSDYNLAFNRVIEDFEEEYWYMDPVKLIKYSWQFLFGESITEEVDKYPAA